MSGSEPKTEVWPYRGGWFSGQFDIEFWRMQDGWRIMRDGRFVLDPDVGFFWLWRARLVAWWRGL